MTNRYERECVNMWDNDFHFHVSSGTYRKVKLAGNFFVGSSVRLCPVTDLYHAVIQQVIKAVSPEGNSQCLKTSGAREVRQASTKF